jgi:hypothetical protein
VPIRGCRDAAAGTTEGGSRIQEDRDLLKEVLSELRGKLLVIGEGEQGSLP